MFGVRKKGASHKSMENSMATLADSRGGIEVAPIAHRCFDCKNKVWSVGTHKSNLAMREGRRKKVMSYLHDVSNSK